MKKFCSLRRIVLLFSFLLFSAMLWAGGVLSSPRRVYVITTKHFEIMFPKESAATAKYIADNADSLYDKAKEIVGDIHDFSMPIIISPDSDVLDASYSTLPYNRIIVFDALETFGLTDDSYPLLDCLYREIFRAVSCSVRSPFNHFIHKTVGRDAYQPISLMYLPFAFAQAYIDISTGCLNDAYYQQLLIQAKLEDNFPSWFQAASLRDIYPGNDICYAAASAFSAFLMQTYGIEKYADFWKECGNMNLLFMPGIFYKVYNEQISNVWKSFKDTVPLPSDMNHLAQMDNASREVFNTDSQRLFSNILYTNYGVVWYDAMCHEVDIYDSKNNVFGLRQLLFIAEEIERLTLSPDGRYILVSFTREKNRKEFNKVNTSIFDLKEREFLDYSFDLRDSAFVTDEQGNLCVAGVEIESKKPVIQIYKLKPENESSDLIYEEKFERSSVPHLLNPAGDGKISYLLSDNKESYFAIQNFSAEKKDSFKTNVNKKIWKILDNSGQSITPISMIYHDSAKEKIKGYSFSYLPKKEGQLARAGFISVDDNSEPQTLYLQDCNISGGVYYPVLNDGRVYYCAKKSTHDELRYLSAKIIPYVNGSLQDFYSDFVERDKYDNLTNRVQTDNTDNSSQTEFTGQNLFSDDMKKLGDYDVQKYNPLKYVFHMSVIPFIAIRDINTEKGPIFWPSLGLTLNSGSDPMKNTKFYISASADFLQYYFEKYIKGGPEEERQVYEEYLGGLRKYNAAAYIRNSSTPVDISAGALWEVDKDGRYDFKGVASTNWNIPVGRIIRNLNFSINGIYKSSTSYYDTNKAEVYKEMPGWTPLWDAYELMELSAEVKYSNSHQYGISKYERRGFTLGGRLYSLWDMYEMEILNQYRDNEQKKIDEGKTELTKAQLDAIYEENLMNISQLNFGASLILEIPRLTPLEIHKGWVLSLPATIHAEFMNKPGTALEAGAELLLIGNEIQNGFPFTYLFFSRAGLKAGYNLSLIYDTTQVQLPDIRHSSYAWDVLSQSSIYDSVYVTLNTDFLLPIGSLSRLQFNLNSTLEYFIRSESFKISLLFNATF